MGSAQNVKIPKYLIAAHQTLARLNVPIKAKNIAVFNILDTRNYLVELDGQRYQKDSIITNYAENDYMDQYRDLKKFYEDSVGKEIFSPFIPYPNMKNFYPIQVIDLSHQVYHISPKKVQFYEEHRIGPGNARIFVRLIRHRKLEMMSDRNKIVEIKVI